MKTLWNSVATLAAGAAVMFYLDPTMGKRRRAVLGDKLRSMQHRAAQRAQAQVKRAGDQVRGAVAQGRSHLDGETAASDTKLCERVRSQLGRLTNSPGAIDVTAQSGCVVLHGHILAAEHTPLVQSIKAVDGVHEVDDQLIVHDSPGNIPELQGGVHGHA